MDPLKIRTLLFLLVAVTLITLEYSIPYRKRELSRLERWPSNIVMVIIDTLLIRICFPLGLAGVASWAAVHHFGIFNFFSINNTVSAILTFVVLDLAIYLQHVYSHKWIMLWRFHKVHHVDTDLDLTTALRFHPVEIFYSYILKMFIVLIFGANPTGILIFEIVLNSMAMFNHANFHIPKNLESKLRLFVVTPQMHIIHHSVEKNESDKNFGFNFTIWDFLFKTYQESFISKGIIGQIGFNKAQDQKLLRLLTQPFRKLNNNHPE